MSSGLYESAGEVVREALRLLREREAVTDLRLAELRRQLQVGLDQLDRGESRPVDRALMEAIARGERP